MQMINVHSYKELDNCTFEYSMTIFRGKSLTVFLLDATTFEHKLHKVCSWFTCFCGPIYFFLHISTVDTFHTIACSVFVILNVSTHLLNYQINLLNKRIQLKVMNKVASDCLGRREKTVICNWLNFTHSHHQK